MSELLGPLGDENSVEPCSEIRSEEARTPLNATRIDNDSLNASSIVGLELVHQGWDSSDARGVARINPPSDVGFNIDSLDVGNDIGSGMKCIKVNPLLVMLPMIASH